MAVLPTVSQSRLTTVSQSRHANEREKASMWQIDASWDAAALACAVCDSLIADGRLKARPAFIRTDREAKIKKVFARAGLDGSKLVEMTARGVEVALRKVTQGEAWVDDVQRVYIHGRQYNRCQL